MSKKQKNGTGTFITRKNGTIEYRVSVGIDLNWKDKRKSFYAATEKEAVKKYKERLKNSDNMPIEKIKNIAEWCDKWLDLYKKDKVAYSTYKNYKMYVENHVKPALGHLRFDQVRPAHIEQFYSQRKNLSDSALRHIYLTLKGIFDTAIENNFCKSSPVKPPNFPRKEERGKTVFTPTELKKLVKVANLHEYGTYVLILLYTGMRMGELLALQWTDVDKKNGIITVRQAFSKAEGGGYKIKSTKSGKARYVGITPNLQTILNNLPRKGIFVLSDEKGFPLTPDGFTWRYKKVFKDNNLDYLSPHKCRHTYATYLLKGGADLRTVQTLLGHAQVTTTEIYTNIDLDDIKRVKLAY